VTVSDGNWNTYILQRPVSEFKPQPPTKPFESQDCWPTRGAAALWKAQIVDGEEQDTQTGQSQAMPAWAIFCVSGISRCRRGWARLSIPLYRQTPASACSPDYGPSQPMSAPAAKRTSVTETSPLRSVVSILLVATPTRAGGCRLMRRRELNAATRQHYRQPPR